jgi:hypothetical protein
MKITPLSLIGLFIEVDDLCKEKKIMPLGGPGRKSGLSVSEIVTIYVWFLRSKVKDFKTFYEGCQGRFLRKYFPATADYSNFLKQKKKQAKAFFSLAQREEKSGFLLIDSTPLPVCENVRSNRHRTFRGVANWTHSSTKTTFGLKLHLVLTEKQKTTQFEISSGNLHDVACAKSVLKKCQGIVIGDKGYCSKPLKKQLQEQGLRLVARHKKNMTPNTPMEKKLLRKRSLIETAIGKFKALFGFTLSNFRSQFSAFASISLAIFAFNIPS